MKFVASGGKTASQVCSNAAVKLSKLFTVHITTPPHPMLKEAQVSCTLSVLLLTPHILLYFNLLLLATHTLCYFNLLLLITYSNNNRNKNKIIIIMYIYHALINALSTHMIHINLNTIFYTHTCNDCSRNWILILVWAEIL